jgi:hypothetical protein
VEIAPGEDCLAVLLDAQRQVRATIDAHNEVHQNLPLSLKLAVLAEAIIMEGAELKAWLPWKLWKADYGRELTDEEREGALEELVDLLHFVLEGFLELGVDDARTLAGYYLAKAAVNEDRQREGY